MTYFLEHWKPVVGYEGIYEISNTGDVCRVLQGRGTKPFKRLTHVLAGSTRDYHYVNLCRDGICKLIAVHRLGGEAFLGPLPTGLHTNHKNGKKSCNRLSNLEYITPSENQLHAVRHYLQPRKLTDHDVRLIRRLVENDSISAVARRFGVGHTIVSEIKRGIAYGWLE